MKFIDWYKQARVAHRRAEAVSSDTIRLFCQLLRYSITLLCLLLTEVIPSRFLLWFDLFYFYMTISYNLPAIVAEYRLGKFRTYKVHQISRKRLFLYLLFENNVLISLAICYLVGNVLLHLLNLSRLLTLVFAMCCVLIGLWSRFISPFIVKFIGFVILGASLFLWIVYPELRIICVSSVLAIFMYFLRYNHLQKTDTIKIYPRIRAMKKWLHLPALPIYRMAIEYRKTIMWSVTSIVIGCLFRSLHISFTVPFFLFYSLIHLEILLDQKYKYITKFIGRYLYVSKTQLSFLERFYLSDNYSCSIELIIYSSLFALVSGMSGLAICVQLFTLMLLGLLYYWAEERTFATQQKTNGFLFQYLVFLGVMFVSYVIGSL